MHKWIEFDNYYSAKKYFIAANQKYNPSDYFVNLYKDNITNKWTVEIEQLMSYWQVDLCFET